MDKNRRTRADWRAAFARLQDPPAGDEQIRLTHATDLSLEESARILMERYGIGYDQALNLARSRPVPAPTPMPWRAYLIPVVLIGAFFLAHSLTGSITAAFVVAGFLALLLLAAASKIRRGE